MRAMRAASSAAASAGPLAAAAFVAALAASAWARAMAWSTSSAVRRRRASALCRSAVAWPNAARPLLNIGIGIDRLKIAAVSLVRSSRRPPPPRVRASDEHLYEHHSLMHTQYAFACLKQKKTTHKTNPQH